MESKIKNSRYVSGNGGVAETLKNPFEEMSKLVLLGELTASTLHEIGNILAVCGMTFEQIEDRLQGNSSCEITKLEVKRLTEGCARLNSIAASAKSMARNTDADPLQKHSLKKLVEDAFRFVRPYLQKEIEPTLDIPENLEVWCRPGEMLQILLNLLKNSWEAIKVLDDKWIKVVARTDGKGSHLYVIDSGSGIPAQVIPLLGEKIITTKPPGVGTGLGLKTSHSIMKSYGGSLSVDTENKNTCMVLSFPVRAA